MAQIAFYTLGLLHEQDQRIEFDYLAERIPIVYQAAEQAPGFVALIHRRPGEVKPLPQFVPADQFSGGLSILSVWQDLESVFRFSYQGLHAEALRRRHDWFRKTGWPSHVAWWIREGEQPTFGEAVQRMDHLFAHDATAYAFTFQRPFDEHGQLIQVRHASGSSRSSTKGKQSVAREITSAVQTITTRESVSLPSTWIARIPHVEPACADEQWVRREGSWPTVSA